MGRGAGPAQTAKKINTPPPLPSVFCFCCLGGWACLFVCCLDGGACFFCCLGEWRCFCFLLFGPVRVFFAVWAGGVFIVLLFGRGGGGGGRVFFCCLGGGREFTHLPVCLARLQATQQQKRPTGSNENVAAAWTVLFSKNRLTCWWQVPLAVPHDRRQSCQDFLQAWSRVSGELT